MALDFSSKQALVAEVNSVAAEAQSAVAAEYRGLTVAEMTELSASVGTLKKEKERAEHQVTELEAAVVEKLRAANVGLVVLAGYMRVVKAPLLEAFPGRILNVHPSLLPAFPGLHAWEQALAYGVRVTGCTVHFVTEGVDEGPIILQAAIPILDNDSPETLAARILVQEHKLYPRAVELYAEGRVRVEGRRVLIEQGKPVGDAVIGPS